MFGLLEQAKIDTVPGLRPMTLHHVGWAVRSIDEAKEYFCDVMGFKPVSETIDVPPQKVRVAFLEMNSSTLLELVEPATPGSPIEQLLERTGGGAYHVCFQVEDINRAIKQLRKRGFFRLTRFELAAHGMKRFAFLLTPDRQLFELCEPDQS